MKVEFAPKQPPGNSRREALRPEFGEEPSWRTVQGGWRQLYGGFYDKGVSIESHEFELKEDLEWSRSFHPESLEICLNVAGRGVLWHRGSEIDFAPLTCGFYAPGRQELQAVRVGGERHQFITVEFSIPYLRAHLGACDGALHRLVQANIETAGRSPGLVRVVRLTTEQEHLVTQLRHPPVFQGARGLWYRSKTMQLMSEFLFAAKEQEELFCDRHKRLARERVERVVSLLRQHLAEPPALESLGREVGCSPYYLSRTFSAEMACTIPQFLRKIRIEKAAELLRSGRYNVTEAAMEVGYSSLSHFSQAFCQVMGCCPGLYPLSTATQSLAALNRTAPSGS